MAHHTKDKGDLAVGYAIYDLTKKGFDVFTPVITEHCKFDLIAGKDDTLYRLQVKYRTDGTVPKSTNWSDKNGTHKSEYKQTDFDYYAIYLPDIETMVYPSITFMGTIIKTKVPNSATPFWWYEDFLDFTDTANKKTYKDFGLELTKRWTEKNAAAAFKNRKVERPSKEELEKMVWESPMIEIADKFGVSDKAVSKWAKSYGITKPPMGYWNRKPLDKTESPDIIKT